MKKFNFEYGKAVLALLILVIAFSVGAAVWNVYNLAVYFSNAEYYGTGKIIFAFFAVAIGVAVTVVALSVLIGSRYVIKGDYLITCLGVIKSKIKISEISALTSFKKSGNLVLYHGAKDYVVIVISPDKYDSFVEALRDVNPAIMFTDNKEEGAA